MHAKDEWRLKLDRLRMDLAGRESLRNRVLDQIEEQAALGSNSNPWPAARNFPGWTIAGIVAFVAITCGVVACYVGLRSSHPAFNVIQRPLPAGDLAVSLQLTARHHTGKEVVTEKAITMRVSPQNGRTQPTNTLMAYSIRSSPDGRYVALNAADEFVRVFRSTGEAVATLNTSGTPVWSPDSKSLLCSIRTENGFVTKNYDVESGAASIMALPRTEFVNDWSQDGAWLATVSSRHEAEGYTYQIYLRTPGSDDERRVRTGGATYALRPRFSHDGRLMVFVLIENQVGRLGILDLRNQQVRLIPGEWDGSVHACWSPDDKALAVKTTQTLGIVDVGTGRYDELEIDVPLRAGRFARLLDGDLSAMTSNTPMFIGGVEWLKP